VLLVDSTVWIDYFNGRVTPQTDHLDRILPRQPILVGDLILAEALQGLRSDPEFDRARRALGKFTQVSVVNPDRPWRAQGTTAGCAVEGSRFVRSSTVSSKPTASRQATSCCIAIKTTIHSRSTLGYARPILYGEEECKDTWATTSPKRPLKRSVREAPWVTRGPSFTGKRNVRILGMQRPL
jgi:hypothetical protein